MSIQSMGGPGTLLTFALLAMARATPAEAVADVVVEPALWNEECVKLLRNCVARIPVEVLLVLATVPLPASPARRFCAD